MRNSNALRIAAVLLAAFLSLRPERSATAQDRDIGAGAELLNPLSSIPPSSLTGFVERPLFAPSRRKPEPVSPIVEEIAIPTESLNLQLLGIIMTPQGAIARLVDLDDDTRYSLREGESFRDWDVASIRLSGLTLSKGETTRSFTVFKNADEDAASPLETSIEPPDTTSGVDTPRTPANEAQP